MTYYRTIFESKLFKLYDFGFNLVFFGYGNKLRKLIAKVINKNNKPKYILDMATGTGSVAIELKKMFSDANVIGIDLSKIMLSVAEKKAKKKNIKIDFMLSDIEKTNFQKNKFDAVTISFALHELPEKDRYNVMKEAYRISKKQGVFAIMDFSLPKNIILKLLQSVLFKIAEEDYAKTILNENLEKELNNIGFKDIKKELIFFNCVQLIKAVK